MEYDHKAANTKHEELLQIAIQALPSSLADRKDLGEKIVEGFVKITPPAHESRRIESLTIENAGQRGGSSVKPGNILLSPKKLVKILPDIVLTTAGLNSQQQWVIPFAMLHIWNTLWSNLTIEIDRSHAMAIVAMWTHRDSEDRITEDEAFINTNELLETNGFLPLSQAEFTKVITELGNMRCIELDNGVIWLREWVRLKYT